MVAESQPVVEHTFKPPRPPRQLVRVLQPPMESNNHIVIVPVQWFFVKSVAAKARDRATKAAGKVPQPLVE
jgi:hypothetical protein